MLTRTTRTAKLNHASHNLVQLQKVAVGSLLEAVLVAVEVASAAEAVADSTAAMAAVEVVTRQEEEEAALEAARQLVVQLLVATSTSPTYVSGHLSVSAYAIADIVFSFPTPSAGKI